ncbi:MAG: UDP-N-acetylmuramoyl-L-alanine--D-glutamate ligase [Alphaproteobacteria bacterium]|nr:UDP-N-acetylmuramoyl-L-alanine--D-glutamate ligase [Alphaproteobacteria bacterium]
MIIPTHYKNQKIVVLGLGRSGRSVAHSLCKAGAYVFAWDDQEEARKAAEKEGIPLKDIATIEWENIDYFLLSPGIPHQYPAPHPAVTQARIANVQPISDLEVLWQSHPRARYIGITGTNGKSTTTTLIGHTLRQSGVTVEVGGNLGIPVMEFCPIDEEGVYVLEVSSYQLEISPHLHFDVSVLLNITPDHLERHGGMEGYIEAKKLIYKNGTPQDTLVISLDDLPCLTIYEALKDSGSIKLFPISTCKTLSQGVYVKEGILYEDSQKILNLNILPFLQGQHNWQNIAAAYGALRSVGLDRETVLEGITSFRGLAHRQQIMAEKDNVTFINDSKGTNAEAVAKALTCFKHRPIYWLLGGRPKEGGIEVLKPYFPFIEHAFLFGEAASSFSLCLGKEVPHTLCKSLKEATELATSLAFKEEKSQAVVLLSPACASFDQFRDFEVRGEAFCQYVDELINGYDDQAIRRAGCSL